MTLLLICSAIIFALGFYIGVMNNKTDNFYYALIGGLLSGLGVFGYFIWCAR